MPVNAVNNVSFSGKNPIKKEFKQAKRDQYYKWVSQNQTNDVLKMSVGREVENGKYEAASTAAKTAGLVGGLASICALYNLGKKMPAVGPLSKKFINQCKAANAGLFLSSAALITSSLIKNKNLREADKTANERGFMSSKDRMGINNANLNYTVTDIMYNEHVN